MADPPHVLARWTTFAGCVLVVAVLYWAQTVIIPVSLALLITFVLTSPVSMLQRWIGRVASVLVVVALVFSVLGAAGWALASQVSALAADLPRYRDNIRQKVADVRRAGTGGSVEKVQQTLEEIRTEIQKGEKPVGNTGRPVVVQSEQVASLWGLPSWVSPAIGPLSTAGLVFVMVVFMLLEREQLRLRLVGLFGHGQLAVTTRAFDEAGQRVSRQLLMQSLVNGLYGVAVAAGLWWLEVPYPFFFAVLGASLRFIPYLGPLLGAGLPILVSLAALPGWTQPLWVIALFVSIELFTNLVLETVLYAGAAGVSQVALLVAVAFWTWLWGPMGMLLATPMTVCLVVLGKHVPGLQFLALLMSDVAPMPPDMSYYQRLLAHDQSEAADLLEAHAAKVDVPPAVDALVLPALAYARQDRKAGRLSAEEEAEIHRMVRDLSLDTIDPPFSTPETTRVLGYAMDDVADELALQLLAQAVRADGIGIELAPRPQSPSRLAALLDEKRCAAICIADVLPSQASRTRYLVRRLRALRPDMPIIVGRWAPPALSDEKPAAMTDAGASDVSNTITDTQQALLNLASPRAVPRAASA